jgi:hypothetical protein
MFSISKILALVAILGAVWYGFKLIGRLDEARRRKEEVAKRGTADRSAPRRDEEASDGVLDLVKDDSGNYVAKDKRDDRV